MFNMFSFYLQVICNVCLTKVGQMTLFIFIVLQIFKFCRLLKNKKIENRKIVETKLDLNVLYSIKFQTNRS